MVGKVERPVDRWGRGLWVQALLGAWLLAGLAVAEDRVWVRERGLVKGEIVAEDGGALAMVALDGEVVQVPRGDVIRVQRGGPLDVRVQERLQAAGSDPEALFALAEWAGRSGLDADARRMALRVLMHQADHEKARGLLGHARAFGTWYVDVDAASKALQGRLKQEGFVRHGKAWVAKDHLIEVKRNPDAWMVVDRMFWRVTREVMEERGCTLWEGEWYPPEERCVLIPLEELQKRTGVVAHGASVANCRVFTTLGREASYKIAREMGETRRHMVDLLELAVDPKQGLPYVDSYLLDSEDAFERYLTAYARELDATAEEMEHFRSQLAAYWGQCNRVVYMDSNWEGLMTRDVGIATLRAAWGGDEAAPSWLERGAGHYAELYGSGRAQVVFHLANDIEHLRWQETADGTPGGLAGWRRMVAGLARDERLPGVADQFAKDAWGARTAEHDLGAAGLFDFLANTERDALVRFIRSETRDPVARFEAAFGAGCDAIDQRFREWLAGFEE